MANTLAEYYSGQGQSLPSISERAKIYESSGLGAASTYAGTAAQNTALLGKLQVSTAPAISNVGSTVTPGPTSVSKTVTPTPTPTPSPTPQVSTTPTHTVTVTPTPTVTPATTPTVTPTPTTPPPPTPSPVPFSLTPSEASNRAAIAPQVTVNIPPATTSTGSAKVIESTPKYVRLTGSNAVFDISSGTPKYVSAADAAKIPNFFTQVKEVNNVSGLNNDRIAVIDSIVKPTGAVDIGKVNEIITKKDLTSADLAKYKDLGTESDMTSKIAADAQNAFLTNDENPAAPKSPGEQFIANTNNLIKMAAAMTVNFDAVGALQTLQEQAGLPQDRADLAKLEQDRASLEGIFNTRRAEINDDPNFSQTLKKRHYDFLDGKEKAALDTFDNKIAALEKKISANEANVTDLYNAELKNYELQSGLKKDQITMLMNLNDKLDKATDNDRQWFTTIVQNVSGTAWDDLSQEEKDKFVSGFSDPSGWEPVLKAAMNASYKNRAADLALQKLAISASKSGTTGANVDTRTVTTTDANGLSRSTLVYYDKNTLQEVAREDLGATGDLSGPQGIAFAIKWLQQNKGAMTSDQAKKELINAGIDISNATVSSAIGSYTSGKPSGNAVSLQSYLSSVMSPQGVIYNNTGMSLGQAKTGQQILDQAIVDHAGQAKTREELRDLLLPALNAYLKANNISAQFTADQVYNRILQLIPNR